MKPYHKQPAEELLMYFNSNVNTGLSTEEVKQRLSSHGPNELKSTKQKSLVTMFFEQFKSSMVVILFIAAIISGIIGVIHHEGLTESYVILAILIINAIIGTVQERKAQSSLDALNRMSAPQTKVLRGGQVAEVVSTAIVPGDIVILDTGDIIPADLRLLEAVNMKVQESA